MAPHYGGFCCRSFSTWWAIMGQYKDFKEYIVPVPLLTTDFAGCWEWWLLSKVVQTVVYRYCCDVIIIRVHQQT